MAMSKLSLEVIVYEILPRLPAKSLLRFKCVSKYFKSLISTPDFIRRHLRRSLSSDADRLLILFGKDGGGVYSFHLDSPEFPALRLPFPGHVNQGRVSGNGNGLFFVGSCNGLVCIGTRAPSLIIFNPCTGIFREVCCGDFPVLDSCINHAFGFDAVNDDYKVVRITSYVSYDFDVDDYFAHVTRREVEVYSLNSDSWCLVESGNNQELMRHMESSALIDGHLVHWKLWYPSDVELEAGSFRGGYRIGCFDLRNNRWGKDVPLPLPYYYLENDSNGSARFGDDIQLQIPMNRLARLVHLGVLDGCLCLLIEDLHSFGEDVWVMKEYGVKDSWVKLGTISFTNANPHLDISPFAFAKGSRSDILVRMDSQSNFFWYNIRDHKWRWTETHGVPAYSEACICSGSLVSIPGGVRFQIEP